MSKGRTGGGPDIAARNLARDLPARLRSIAERQVADYMAGSPGTWFAEPDWALSLEEAYAVQIEAARIRVAAGDAIAGYKVGCTGTAIRETFGVDGPISGFLFASEVLATGAPVSAGRHENLAVEGEAAVRLGPGAQPVELLVVIELHDYVLRARPGRLQELVAGNGVNAGAVLGAPGLPYPPPGLAGLPLSVAIDGTEVGRGRLDGVPGGIEGSLAWLSRQLGRLGLPLAAGDIVLTGTPLGIFPVAAGSGVEARAGAAGSCSAAITQ